MTILELENKANNMNMRKFHLFIVNLLGMDEEYGNWILLFIGIPVLFTYLLMHFTPDNSNWNVLWLALGILLFPCLTFETGHKYADWTYFKYGSAKRHLRR